jgi:hypothetical protein
MAGYGSGQVLHGFRGFFRLREMVDKILQHRQVSHVQVIKLNAASPATDLVPGAFGNLNVVYDVAWQFVYMNETSVAPKNFDLGTLPLLFGRGQVFNTHPSQADIQDLPQVHELIGLEENRKRAAFSFVSLVPSLIHGRLFQVNLNLWRSDAATKPLWRTKRSTPIESKSQTNIKQYTCFLF